MHAVRYVSELKNMKKMQQGFSLVELVIVIVVVGLLAVAALPRFLDVTDEAKKASIEGVAGGFATGVLSARAQWEAQARPALTANNYPSINYDGVNFWLTTSATSGYRDGYPLGLNTDDATYPSGLTDQACIDLMNNLLQNPPQVARKLKQRAILITNIQRKRIVVLPHALMRKMKKAANMNLFMKLTLVA